MKNKIKEFFERVKNIKHLYVYVAVIIALIVCVFYFSNYKTKNETDNNISNSTEDLTSAEEYASYLENKLCNVLSNLSGVDNVSVAITLCEDVRYEYATDTETKNIVSGGNQTTVTTETVIMVSNEPVVLKTIYPQIKGVVVVANGVKDIGLKMNILSAIETVLQVEPNAIKILN